MHFKAGLRQAQAIFFFAVAISLFGAGCSSSPVTAEGDGYGFTISSSIPAQISAGQGIQAAPGLFPTLSIQPLDAPGLGP